MEIGVGYGRILGCKETAGKPVMFSHDRRCKHWNGWLVINGSTGQWDRAR